MDPSRAGVADAARGNRNKGQNSYAVLEWRDRGNRSRSFVENEQLEKAGRVVGNGSGGGSTHLETMGIWSLVCFYVRG